MKIVVVSIFDLKLAAFGRPAFVPSVGAAIRGFADEVSRNDEHNLMFKHPSDFVLYELGLWDDEFGKFTCDNPPKVIAHGSDVKT